MARLISANKLNRLWKKGVMLKTVLKTNVLKSMEEITANTNAENVAGALAVKELNDNLGGNIITYENGKFYIQAGADAASKKQLGSNFTINFSLIGWCSHAGSPKTTVLNGGKIVISDGKVAQFAVPGGTFYSANGQGGGRVYINTYSIQEN